MGRRGDDDEAWKIVKQEVRKRDKETCRIYKVLSLSDVMKLRINASFLLNQLDCCHIFPVSANPELTYCSSNIVLLNRYSHQSLDSYRHPVTGEPISKEEVMDWWKKIAGEHQWNALMEEKERGGK